jgi:hypothetical protein
VTAPYFGEKWDLLIHCWFWLGVVHVRNGGAAGPPISGCAGYE